MSLDRGMFLNQILGLLLRKVVTPTDFHSQCEAIEEMLRDDLSGLVDVLTDFEVESAGVKFSIESTNGEYSRILNKWLETLNIEYSGRIPAGINAIAKEYYKERWKGSSFPVLKLGGWKKIEASLEVPTKMYFVDGSSIYSKNKDEKEVRSLFNYDYYLDRDMKYKLEGADVIFARPYGRWFDEYPVPYLIKRGVYHNWKIVSSLKSKQIEILDQILPYLLLVKKGTAELTRDQAKSYSDEELGQIKERIQELFDKLYNFEEGHSTNKTATRVTNFDEEIKHLIPDISTMFDGGLFEVAERNILSGLGFVDVVEATSTSRRESILNPKAFIEETKSGVKDFKEIIKQVIYLVQKKNENHKKYNNVDFYVINSPVTAFATDDFKEKIRQLYDRGRISSQTAVELIAEVDFKTEVIRREKESREGIEETMYPVVTMNREGEGIDFPSDLTQTKETDINDEDIPDDKKDETEKQNYNIGKFEFAVKCSKCNHIFDLLAEVEDKMGSVLCPKCGNYVSQKDAMDLEEAFAPVITENYIRIRQRNPEDFQKNYFRTKVLSDKEGIKAIIGRPKGEKTTTIQSYLFDKTKWNTKDAETWVEKNKAEDENLETAPYQTIQDLSPKIRKNLSPDLQEVFIRVFNQAYETYKNESKAFRISWGVINKITKKNKSGKWVKKASRVKITKAMIEEVLDFDEEDAIEEAMKQKEVEILNKKDKLLSLLLDKKTENQKEQ